MLLKFNQKYINTTKNWLRQTQDQLCGFSKVWNPKITRCDYGEQNKQKYSTLVTEKKKLYVYSSRKYYFRDIHTAEVNSEGSKVVRTLTLPKEA